MLRRLVPFTAAGLALAAAAPAAQAATARVVGSTIQDDSCRYAPDECRFQRVEFRGARGERNALTVSKRTDGRIVFADANADITAGTACEQVDARTVACTTDPGPAPGPRPVTSIDVRLGDGADTARARNTGLRAAVYGGSGADRLTGSTGNDVLYGDSGADKLNAGAGNDIVYGGTDDDSLLGGSGIDFLHGGRGLDFLSGGDGADRLRSRDTEVDRVSGGNGRDDAIADRDDRVSGVETVRV